MKAKILRDTTIDGLAEKINSFRPLTGTLLSKHHPPILPPQAAFFAGLRGK